MPSLDVIPRLVFTVLEGTINLKDKSNSQFQDQAKVFMSQGANKDDIITAGETAVVCLYNGDPQHGINVLRYEKFLQKLLRAQCQFNLLHFLLSRRQSNTTA